MPPKEKPSKKTVRDKQAKTIEDSTFGLKNKNKSKKVQQFIERVEKTVKHSNGALDAAKAKEAKKDAKLAQQLQEEELRILFNEGISNQFGKKKTKAKAAAESMGLGEINKDVEKLFEEMSSDDDDSDDDNGDPRSGEVYVNQEEVTEIEVFREKTLEDIIEEQRAKLAAEGKTGTPVTAESFAKWRAAKLLQRQADAEARMKIEQSKKKGGKGLSVLSGKELFNYNSALFVDDDAAIDAAEEGALAAETKRSEEADEAKAAAEAEKAQEEQRRLMEIQRIEEEECRRKDEERRALAMSETHPTFMLGDVVINQVVFDVTEKEDLEPFPEIDESRYGRDDEEDDDEDDDEEGDDQDDDDEGAGDGGQGDGAVVGGGGCVSGEDDDGADEDDSYVLVEAIDDDS